jgi:anti-anti-sigma factor
MSSVSIEHQDLADELRLIQLAGRLDMVGAGEIELRFTTLAATKPIGVLVDLTQVTFLASVGLRCIIHSAKALDQKGGRMALLLGDNALVLDTLETVGIDEIIPVFSDRAEALASFGAESP